VRRPGWWAAGVAAAVLASACAGSADPVATSPSPDATVPSPAPTASSSPARSSPDTHSPPAAGDPHEQLAFEAPLLDGGTFDGAVSGDVVLWFWAPW